MSQPVGRGPQRRGARSDRGINLDITPDAVAGDAVEVLKSARCRSGRPGVA
ncbi:hypothetical protein ACWCPF_37650 [Streptomyces sp. NPDC001858]